MLLEALDQTEETFFRERIQKRHVQQKEKKDISKVLLKKCFIFMHICINSIQVTLECTMRKLDKLRKRSKMFNCVSYRNKIL